MKGTFERLPRHDEFGVDWGAERTLIARADSLELAWVSGSTWYDGVGRHYGASSLTLRDNAGKSRCGENLLTGGRLSVARLREIRPQLVMVFGEVGTNLILAAFRERRSASLTKENPR